MILETAMISNIFSSFCILYKKVSKSKRFLSCYFFELQNNFLVEIFYFRQGNSYYFRLLIIYGAPEVFTFTFS